MDKRPLVSVVIASYNYGQYIAEAVASVRDQTYRNVEIIIIDDGSTDNSAAIARSIDDPRISVITQANEGVVAVRNTGIERAAGEFIVFLDADDVLPTDYIENNLLFLAESGADIASTDLILFGNGMQEHRDVQPEFSLERMKQGNIVHIGSMVRRSCIGDSRFDPSLSGRSHEDWDFFLGLGLKGADIRHNSGTALMYRQHVGSRNNHEDSDEKKFEYARVYRDVIHKYALQYPDQLGYLASTRFANFITYIDDVVLPRTKESLNETLRQAMGEKDEILRSKEYRLGARLLNLPREIVAKRRARRN